MNTRCMVLKKKKKKEVLSLQSVEEQMFSVESSALFSNRMNVTLLVQICVLQRVDLFGLFELNVPFFLFLALLVVGLAVVVEEHPLRP